MSNLSQRDAFWEEVYKRACTDRDIVVISADMGAPALDRFRRDLAGQFVNVGIAEHNAITVGSGLALAGKKVFAYAIAPFITLRVLEQIRVENAMMKIPLAIVGVGAGFGYEDSGPTHHLIEDIAVMRALPHITIHSISDSVMAAHVAGALCATPAPAYIRLDREMLPDLYTHDADFNSGLAVLKEGRDGFILSTGSMVHAALRVADAIRANASLGVIDVYRFPIDADALLEAIGGTKKLVTIEEHFLAGGLGSAVLEVLMDRGITISVKRLGCPMESGYCYQYGGRETIRKYYGIDDASILHAIQTFLAIEGSSA